MPGVHVRLRAVLVLTGLLAAGCAAQIEGEAVTGAPIDPLLPIQSDGASLRQEFERSAHEINDYWTTARTHDAVPFDPIPAPDRISRVSDPATGVVVHPTTGAVSPDGPQTPQSAAGDRFAADGLAAATHGRLYMEFNGGMGVCSATVVNSAGKDLIATAAHCIWDSETATLADYVMFIPADRDNGAVAPHGRWFAVATYFPQEFADGAFVGDSGIYGDGWAYDFAFIELAPDDAGRRIQDVTGGQGIAFGVPAEELLVVGYPSVSPFDGTSQRYCAADDWYPDGYAYTLSCEMTPGCSGGSWMTNYDPATGSGYLIATTSFGGRGYMGAAPLGARALQVFTEAGGI